MTQTIKIKRSDVSGKVPTPSDLELGELAINTFDGKLYAKKNDGVDTVIDLSSGGSTSYTGGFGIDITGSVISSTIKSDGTNIAVQIGDGAGNFVAVPQQPAGRVLTSNGTMPPTWEPVPVSGGTVTSVDVSGGTTGIIFTGGPIEVDGEITMEGTLNITNGGTGGTTVQEAQANLLPDQTGNPGAALTTDGAGVLSWVVPPGSAYLAGTGLELTGNVFNSIVADNTGELARVVVSSGDGTVHNLPAGIAGYVLTSNGTGTDPTWENISGTVSSIKLLKNNNTGLFISGGDPVVPPDPDMREITTTGTLSLSGILTVLNGGTGGSTPSDAINNLLPLQTNNETKFLTTNGDDVSWASPFPDQTGLAGYFLKTNGTSVAWDVPAGGGTVISVDVDGDTTGLTFTGGPVTTAGVLTLGGTLSIANGGTGADNAEDAINNLVPNQAANAGKILTTNGTVVSWGTTGAGTVMSVDIDGGSSGLVFGGGPITTSGVFTIGGSLAIANGGTGGSSAQQARNNILPPQASNNGKILGTNGTDVSWVTTGAGSVTSVNVDGSTTGLTFTGGPITSSGTLTLGGTLSILNGGTGASTAQDAINNLVPSQTGNAGKTLSTNGTEVSWTTAGAGSVTSVNVSGSTTGLTFSGGPITSSGTLTLGGTLALANGGTGGTSAQEARNNILPAQSTHAGQVLSTDGTNVSWITVTGGTVTSVNADGGTTGLTFTGGPITASGTLTLGGMLAIANGGTGAATASAAFTALAPNQIGNAGKVLTTNGTTISWANASTLGTIAAGSNEQIQFNDSGALGASASLTFTPATSTLAVPSLSTTTEVDLSGSVFGTAVAVPGSTIDCGTGTYFTKTATGALSWSFSNVPVSGKAYIFALALQDGGSGVQTWPGSVVWPGGTAPTLTAGGVDLLIFSTSTNGATWRGSSILNYSA